jgi:hypothetical protein
MGSNPSLSAKFNLPLIMHNGDAKLRNGCSSTRQNSRCITKDVGSRSTTRNYVVNVQTDAHLPTIRRGMHALWGEWPETYG